MREFFRGWRRKAGGLTLLIACVLVGMWIRSLVIWDDLLVMSADTRCDLNSERGRFSIEWRRSDHEGALFTFWRNDTYENFDIRLLRFLDDDAKSKFVWRLDCIGVSIGTLSPKMSDDFEMHFVVVSYWVAALPLTLLSAYLILWKPRKRV